jgi:hypothetical protein
MGRFKSTENIISGIVGKDDQGLGKLSVAEDLGAIPKQRQRAGSYHDDDDDMDIKEKEQLLMEKWEQEHGSSSTLNTTLSVCLKRRRLVLEDNPSWNIILSLLNNYH